MMPDCVGEGTVTLLVVVGADEAVVAPELTPTQ